MPSPTPEQADQTPAAEPEPNRLPVGTLHCRFCSHLLLATTRDIPRLPRRKDPSKDAAIILPLPSEPADPTEDEPGGQNQHSTLLLSTTIPDRKPTLVRREDGIEKRIFLRCGRCRVVVGYFLDEVHFPSDIEDRGKVVYLLPGGLMETEAMGDEDRLKATDREWAAANW